MAQRDAPHPERAPEGCLFEGRRESIEPIGPVSMNRDPRFMIRRLEPLDASLYRELRLEALRLHPHAYGSTFESESAAPLYFFEQRLASSEVLLGSIDSAPMGIVRFSIPTFVTERHKGMLTGMYVREGARGTGLAATLVDAVIERARGRVIFVELSVVTTNERARRLYARHGFEIYGVDPCALKHGDRYFDEYLMTRFLEPPPGWAVPKPPSVAWR
jgi:ribosomal protein S18 acetylase RimI-like enzyme